MFLLVGVDCVSWAITVVPFVIEHDFFSQLDCMHTLYMKVLLMSVALQSYVCLFLNHQGIHTFRLRPVAKFLQPVIRLNDIDFSNPVLHILNKKDVTLL